MALWYIGYMEVISVIQKRFNLAEDTVQRLEELAKIYNKSQTRIIADLIHADYDRLQGNPELKKMISKLNELQDAINTFGREGREG